MIFKMIYFSCGVYRKFHQLLTFVVMERLMESDQPALR